VIVVVVAVVVVVTIDSLEKWYQRHERMVEMLHDHRSGRSALALPSHCRSCAADNRECKVLHRTSLVDRHTKEKND